MLQNLADVSQNVQRLMCMHTHTHTTHLRTDVNPQQFKQFTFIFTQ